MIIDSHAHYCHPLYTDEFPYVGVEKQQFTMERGRKSQLFQAMRDRGIVMCIEPSTGLDRIEAQLSLAGEYAPYVRLALGVHPKQAMLTPWEDRELLRRYVFSEDAIAIGETGLDYGTERTAEEIELQKRWFTYQIELAHERGLPLVLHVRDAYEDAVNILTAHRNQLHGGVAHCYRGNYQTAMELIDLGFAIGMGGKLLDAGEEGQMLRDVVRCVPLSALLIETDAPYIRPDVSHLGDSHRQRKKIRNSSLILPVILDTIAEIRGESRLSVEEAIYQNTLRVFGLQEEST